MQIQPNLNNIHTCSIFLAQVLNHKILTLHILERSGIRHYGIGWPPQSYENTIEVKTNNVQIK